MDGTIVPYIHLAATSQRIIKLLQVTFTAFLYVMVVGLFQAAGIVAHAHFECHHVVTKLHAWCPACSLQALSWASWRNFMLGGHIVSACLESQRVITRGQVGPDFWVSINPPPELC